MIAAAINKPVPGDRIGIVCGPGEFPRDCKGTVIATYSNRFYKDIGVILMDDGTTKELVGQYTKVGIGVYLLNRKDAA